MTHDPMCPLNERCNADHVEHGFCSRQSTFCIHCERECRCEEYARVRADERGKRIQEGRDFVLAIWRNGVDEEQRMSAAFDKGYAAALRDAKAAVEAAVTHRGGYHSAGEFSDCAVAAIAALGGER